MASFKKANLMGSLDGLVIIITLVYREVIFNNTSPTKLDHTIKKRVKLNFAFTIKIHHLYQKFYTKMTIKVSFLLNKK